MLLDNISLLGWLHSIACVIAIVAGGSVLCAAKGTPRHRLWGRWYVAAMIFQSLSILAIYKFDILPGRHSKVGPGVFGIFHILVLATLVAVLVGMFSAARQWRGRRWAFAHSQAMLFSYYLLISGLINEMFARIVPLRNAAMALSPHAFNPVNTLMLREVQSAAMLLWVAVAVGFAIQVFDGRGRAKVLHGMSPSAPGDIGLPGH